MRQFRFALILLSLVPALAAAEKGLETLEQKASYSFGVDFAKRLKQQGIDLDISALNRGIQDQASGSKLAFEAGEMNQFKAEYTLSLIHISEPTRRRLESRVES